MRYTDLVEEAQRLLNRSEKDSWRLAELTHEAVKVKGKTQREWGRDVGRSLSTVQRWLAVWTAYGDTPSGQRPSFFDAMLEIQGGGNPQQERERVREVQVRSALRAHPEIARRLVEDPQVRAIVGTAIENYHRETPRTPSQKRGEDPTMAMVQAMLDMDRSMSKLIENANGARRDGFLTPKQLRDFAEKLRLYADAIESIAESRGLSDEELADWIGESA